MKVFGNSIHGYSNKPKSEKGSSIKDIIKRIGTEASNAVLPREGVVKGLTKEELNALKQWVTQKDPLPKTRFTGVLAEQLADMAFILKCLGKSSDLTQKNKLVDDIKKLVNTKMEQEIGNHRYLSSEHIVQMSTVGLFVEAVKAPTYLLTRGEKGQTLRQDALGQDIHTGDLQNAFCRLGNAVKTLKSLMDGDASFDRKYSELKLPFVNDSSSVPNGGNKV